MARINIVNADNKIESNPRRAYFKLKNTGGPKGDTGAQGPQGPKGDTGAQGPAGLSASVTVGSTTTLAPGASATVTNSGDTRNAVLNFGIPTGAQGPQGAQGPKGDTGPEGAKGAKGDTGAAATVTVANTNTGAPGTNASVENVGDQYNAVLNFTIPRGDKGETGAQGPEGPAGKDFTPTVVTALPETGENGVLYMTEKSHTTQTATGNPITATITDEAGKMEAFQLDGDTFQQAISGKNLVGLTDNTVSQSGLTATVDGDTVTINGTATGLVNLCHANFNLEGMGGKKLAVTVFPISGSWTGGSIGFSLRNLSNTQVFFQQERYDGGTFNANTLSSSALASADHAFVFAGATTVFSDFKFKIMLSDSPVLETTYIPFVGGYPSPNPEYPQPVQTVTGAQTVEILGKNLFNAQGNYIVGGINGNTGAITEDSTDTTVTTGIGSIKVVNSHSSGNFRGYVSDKIVLQAGSYALRFTRAETTGHYVAVFTFDSNDNFLGREITLSGQATSGNGNISNQVAYVRIAFETNTHGTTVTFNDIQLEADSTASTYAPYSKQTLPLDLGTIELAEIGTAQDRIYKDGSAWKIEKQVLKFTPDGSEGWFKSGGTTQTHFVVALSIDGLKTSYAQRAGSKSTHFDYMVSTVPIGQRPGFALYNNSGAVTSHIAFSLPVATANTIAAATAWIASNRPSFYISLDSTGVTTTTITDAALIAQLEAIRTALLENGANTITDTTTSPNLAGDMEIGYYGYTPSSQYDKWLWLDVGAAGAHYEQI